MPTSDEWPPACLSGLPRPARSCKQGAREFKQHCHPIALQNRWQRSYAYSRHTMPVYHCITKGNCAATFSYRQQQWEHSNTMNAVHMLTRLIQKRWQPLSSTSHAIYPRSCSNHTFSGAFSPGSNPALAGFGAACRTGPHIQKVLFQTPLHFIFVRLPDICESSNTQTKLKKSNENKSCLVISFVFEKLDNTKGI